MVEVWLITVAVIWVYAGCCAVLSWLFEVEL